MPVERQRRNNDWDVANVAVDVGQAPEWLPAPKRKRTPEKGYRYSLDVMLVTPGSGRVESTKRFGADEPDPTKMRPAMVAAIRCADGESLSVQASHFHYCTPRNDKGPWTHVEVGFPSVPPPRSWKKYCEDWSDPTRTVYGWVPISLVKRFIKLHGGEVKPQKEGEWA